MMWTRACYGAVVTGILAVTTPQPLQAEAAKVKIPGIYSDLYYNKEGGDLLGTEVFIVYAGNNGFVAFVQESLGQPVVPVAVPVKVYGDKVTFSVTNPDAAIGEYSGRISAGGLEGVRRMPNGSGGVMEEAIHLKRKKSYWQ